MKTLFRPIALLRAPEQQNGRIRPLVTGLVPVNSLWTLIGGRWLAGTASWRGVGLFYLMSGVTRSARGAAVSPQLHNWYHHNWYNELNIHLTLQRQADRAQERTAAAESGRAATSEDASAPAPAPERKLSGRAGRTPPERDGPGRISGARRETAESRLEQAAEPDAPRHVSGTLRRGTVKPVAEPYKSSPAYPPERGYITPANRVSLGTPDVPRPGIHGENAALLSTLNHFRTASGQSLSRLSALPPQETRFAGLPAPESGTARSVGSPIITSYAAAARGSRIAPHAAAAQGLITLRQIEVSRNLLTGIRRHGRTEPGLSKRSADFAGWPEQFFSRPAEESSVTGIIKPILRREGQTDIMTLLRADSGAGYGVINQADLSALPPQKTRFAGDSIRYPAQLRLRGDTVHHPAQLQPRGNPILRPVRQRSWPRGPEPESGRAAPRSFRDSGETAAPASVPADGVSTPVSPPPRTASRSMRHAPTPVSYHTIGGVSGADRMFSSEPPAAAASGGAISGRVGPRADGTAGWYARHLRIVADLNPAIFMNWNTVAGRAAPPRTGSPPGVYPRLDYVGGSPEASASADRYQASSVRGGTFMPRAASAGREIGTLLRAASAGKEFSSRALFSPINLRYDGEPGKREGIQYLYDGSQLDNSGKRDALRRGTLPDADTGGENVRRRDSGAERGSHAALPPRGISAAQAGAAGVSEALRGLFAAAQDTQVSDRPGIFRKYNISRAAGLSAVPEYLTGQSQTTVRQVARRERGRREYPQIPGVFGIPLHIVSASPVNILSGVPAIANMRGTAETAYLPFAAGIKTGVGGASAAAAADYDAPGIPQSLFAPRGRTVSQPQTRSRSQTRSALPPEPGNIRGIAEILSLRKTAAALDVSRKPQRTGDSAEWSAARGGIRGLRETAAALDVSRSLRRTGDSPEWSAARGGIRGLRETAAALAENREPRADTTARVNDRYIYRTKQVPGHDFTRLQPRGNHGRTSPARYARLRRASRLTETRRVGVEGDETAATGGGYSAAERPGPPDIRFIRGPEMFFRFRRADTRYKSQPENSTPAITPDKRIQRPASAEPGITVTGGGFAPAAGTLNPVLSGNAESGAWNIARGAAAPSYPAPRYTAGKENVTKLRDPLSLRAKRSDPESRDISGLRPHSVPRDDGLNSLNIMKLAGGGDVPQARQTAPSKSVTTVTGGGFAPVVDVLNPVLSGGDAPMYPALYHAEGAGNVRGDGAEAAAGRAPPWTVRDIDIRASRDIGVNSNIVFKNAGISPISLRYETEGAGDVAAGSPVAGTAADGALYYAETGTGGTGATGTARARTRRDGVKPGEASRMLSVPNVRTRADAYSSLYYHTRGEETAAAAAGGGLQTDTQPPPRTGQQTQIKNTKPVEHKATAEFKKVDMSVKKPPGQTGDITMDPVQMNRLVSQVYEQVERRMFHERRRMGL